MRNKEQGRFPAFTSSVSDSAKGINTITITLGEWLDGASRRLVDSEEVDYSTSAADIRLIAAKILNISKTFLLAHPEMQLAENQLILLEDGLKRYSNGEALPYILGEWDFYGRTFTLTPNVLIPRPETELMIDEAMEWIRSDRSIRFADVGTGSGCIAVTLAMERPKAHGIACDVSQFALEVARTNIDRHGVQQRVVLMQTDLLSAVASSSLDVICANLPYIPSARLDHLQVAQREPLLALDGGPRGLDLIERSIPQITRILVPGGLALLEIDDTHEQAVLELANRHFKGDARVIGDYQDKPRLLKLINNMK